MSKSSKTEDDLAPLAGEKNIDPVLRLAKLLSVARQIYVNQVAEVPPGAPAQLSAAREYLGRALRALQDRHIHHLTTGEGCGLSTFEMVEVLDKESGYSELYNALVNARRRMMQYGESRSEIEEIDAALDKARGETSL
jgi:hypothetical protein